MLGALFPDPWIIVSNASGFPGSFQDLGYLKVLKVEAKTGVPLTLRWSLLSIYCWLLVPEDINAEFGNKLSRTFYNNLTLPLPSM